MNFKDIPRFIKFAILKSRNARDNTAFLYIKYCNFLKCGIEQDYYFLIKNFHIRSAIKKIISQSFILRRLFIFLYLFQGRSPWSLGYSQYKFNFIRETVEHNLSSFKDKKLPSGYGFGLDERVVEYPWFFARLRDNHKVLLDAGSTLNQPDILNLPVLRDRKLYISTLDREGTYNAPCQPEYVYEDLRHSSFKGEFFDAIVCLSTLEHIGMDNTFLYTDNESKKENNRWAFLEAVVEFKRLLKKGGTLYVTVPYGRYKNHGWFQVFDAEMVQKVLDKFGPSSFLVDYFKYEHRQWQYATAETCQDGYFFDIHQEKTIPVDYLAASQSIVCLELTK